MQLIDKLAILADAAKYDASCASSGTDQRDSKNGKGIGSSGGMGICHSYTPDGRCVSLLKILLTNFCIYECSYCVNRASSQVKRARFTVDEVVKLTIEFYKRNYIEGLFLSSGIIKNEDYTMEQISLIAKKLRTEHDFRGYIHLKTIPDASPELLAEAGKYADRLSINVEMPTAQSLQQFAPEKSPLGIKKSMARLKSGIAEAKAHKRQKKTISNQRIKSHIKFAPAGQSTQMIVGADQSNDRIILIQSNQLYNNFKMRRVYYSAFSPIPDASQALPLIAPPLMREHRLYQADWLLRFYGFEVDEITPLNSTSDGMLDLHIDPKLSWAINHREFFPINLNKASLEHILRIPGIGAMSARRIINMRRYSRIRLIDLQKMRVAIKKVKPFIETSDYHPQARLLEKDNLRGYFIPPEQQQLAF
ncbi:putative DNA modification/repair radical SAM protein [Marinicella sp. S1101]|uniref:putative DNA modification/repair radical SAM protein n=1 Tax=Marinicella marina TaxID=2996016 RepID=UPI0022609C10|nr:putative DNA modification/repair radical SAM protein [Marinicella marina]MCX7553395.1 putative DNA modification/repair radical SAM protein [Marinicella marina]MDJ1140018.1 putative DNA modification/repair radical SAM protein [Marinicella marina]